jgi:hypothetical protein
MLSRPPAVRGAESETLAGIAADLKNQAEKTEDVRQRTMLGHAASEMQAASKAAAAGNEEEAEEHKKKALKWVTWAVKECMKPGDMPGRIAGALKEEGHFEQKELDELDDLFETLVAAKKRKEKSDLPIDDEMAINQIVLAILDFVDTGGHDGWHPQKALRWYLNAAVSCEDVEDMIERILDYMGGHADDTGIPDISPEARKKAKDMLDELYEMKAAGAPLEDIAKKADEIYEFIREEGARVGRARKAHIMGEEQEESETEEHLQAPSVPVTSVNFTALDGSTAVNKEFVGEIERVEFVALDGETVEPQDADTDVRVHGDSIDVDVGRGAEIAGIVLTGSSGVVRLLRDPGSSADPGSEGVAPADGSIDVRNGRLNETFSVGPDCTNVERAPQSHAVSVGGTPAQVVAVRSGQVAVAAGAVGPSATGQYPVTVSSPAGQSISAGCPGWGYDISLPPVTRTEAVVPVTAVVFGLDPAEEVTFRFLPEAGQQVEPEHVTMMAAQLVAPTPIAELRAERVGPQALRVAVSREGGP